MLNLSYRHTFNLGNQGKLIAGASTRIETAYYAGEEYLPGQYQRRNQITDADLAYVSSADRFSLTAYVQNLENKAVIQQTVVQSVNGQPLATLRPPRTYGVRFTVNF